MIKIFTVQVAWGVLKAQACYLQTKSLFIDGASINNDFASHGPGSLIRRYLQHVKPYLILYTKKLIQYTLTYFLLSFISAAINFLSFLPEA